MSFSFNVRAADKAEAVAKVTAEMALVVQNQPIHKKDHDQILAATTAHIGLLRDDPTQDLSISVNGSCWGTDDGLTSASVGVSAGFVPKV
jgi:hypothetical protein